MPRIDLTVAAGIFLFSIGLRPQEPCPDARAWTGKYTNHSYGFAITIPDHLEGFWNSFACVGGPDGCVCMTDHGRIIPLSSKRGEAEPYIEAYGGFAADLDEPTVSREMDKRLGWIRERSRGGIQVRSRSAITLAGLEAERAVVRYYDKKLKSWFIEDFIEALQGGVEYSLCVRTRDTSYGRDRLVFEAVVQSFVLTDE